MKLDFPVNGIAGRNDGDGAVIVLEEMPPAGIRGLIPGAFLLPTPSFPFQVMTSQAGAQTEACNPPRFNPWYPHIVP